MKVSVIIPCYNEEEADLLRSTAVQILSASL